MSQLLPIFVVACLLSSGAWAESISLQSSRALVAQKHTLGAVPKLGVGSSSIARSLGQGERRFALRAGDGAAPASIIPPGSLAPSTDRSLNFGFYKSSEAPRNAFTDLVLRTLFEQKPKGSHGRRAQAQSNSR